MTLKKSLVVGVHDGLKYLPYTLPYVSALTLCLVDEVVFILDRVDDMDAYRKLIAKWVPIKSKIYFKLSKKWEYGPAETFNLGLSMCSGDILYVSAEDIALDPNNFKDEYWEDEDVAMVDFRYYQRDPFKWNFHVKWDNMILKVSDRVFRYGTVRSGIFGVRREVFEELGGLKDCPTEEDFLRKDIIERGYKHLHIKSAENYHLRPSYDRARQIMQGISRREQGFSLKKTIAHSILHLKPFVLYGYLKRQRK